MDDFLSLPSNHKTTSTENKSNSESSEESVDHDEIKVLDKGNCRNSVNETPRVSRKKKKIVDNWDDKDIRSPYEKLQNSNKNIVS